jgi:hypothetical protein
MIRKENRNEKPQPITYQVRIHGEVQTFSYEQLFARGYHLLLTGHVLDCVPVFELLSKVQDRGPRAGILLAFAKAQLGQYGACSGALSNAFEASGCPLDSELHSAVVFWACGLFADAKHELEAIIQQHPEFPTVSLLLGGLLAKGGNRKQPPILWSIAAKNDRPNGAVGMIARKSLTSWLAQSKPR